MKIYSITIKPITGFATPLKGDTIFGHICWQLAYEKAISLDNLLKDYSENPFAVFSSAYPQFFSENDNAYVYALKKPDIPIEYIIDCAGLDKKERLEKKKEFKKKKWMLVKEGESFATFKNHEKYLSDKEIIEKAIKSAKPEVSRDAQKQGMKSFISSFHQPHNTINRNTGATGKVPFAPYRVKQEVYFPFTKLVVFVGIDESRITIEQIKLCLKRIGESGFGKDASTGLGRFKLGNIDEINFLGCKEPNACYTLSPSVPEKDNLKNYFFSPFIRFGKHGDILAKSANPFKNPVIMADEGAVFFPEKMEIFQRPYIGKAIKNISIANPKTVMQGYSLYIPVYMEI